MMGRNQKKKGEKTSVKVNEKNAHNHNQRWSHATALNKVVNTDCNYHLKPLKKQKKKKKKKKVVCYVHAVRTFSNTIFSI